MIGRGYEVELANVCTACGGVRGSHRMGCGAVIPPSPARKLEPLPKGCRKVSLRMERPRR